MSKYLLFITLLMIAVSSSSMAEGTWEHCIDKDWFTYQITSIETTLPKEFIETPEKDFIWISNNTNEPIYELTEKPVHDISALKISGTPYLKLYRLKNGKVCDFQKPFFLFSAIESFSWACSGSRNQSFWLKAIRNPSYRVDTSGMPDKRHPLPEEFWTEKIFLYKNQIYQFNFRTQAAWNSNYGKEKPSCGIDD